MSDEDILNTAVALLREIQARAPEHFNGVIVDQLPTRQIRDTVVIDFSGDENQGKIQVTLERETGKVVGCWHTPPKGSINDDKF